ncbi:hypothetical protein JW859_01360 [bacterium]|nr:hypothetical protein [bacterium]
MGLLVISVVTGTGCAGGYGGNFGWPDPAKQAAWIPYIESIELPDEIFAYRSFEVTVKLSAQANPGLIDSTQYHWMTNRRGPGTGHEGLNTIEIVCGTGSAETGAYNSDISTGATFDELRFRFYIETPGQQTIRVLGTSQPAAGGAATVVFRGYNEGGEYWSFTDDSPAGTAFRTVTINVQQPEFDDLYYYGYLPYVEEFTAPRQVYTDESANVLVRLSTAGSGSGDQSLTTLMSGPRTRYMLYFADEPPAGEYFKVVQFEGFVGGGDYLSVYSSTTREQGGIELILNKHPEDGFDWLKSDQISFDIHTREIDVIQRPEHMYGDMYEVRVPYVEEVVFPETMVTDRPDVIRVRLAADLPDVSSRLGYYLQQEWSGGGDLNAVAVYEPHAQGLVEDELLIIYEYLLPGEHTLSVVSAPAADQGGLASQVMFGEPLSGQLPVGAVRREFSFTVLPAEAE